MKIVDRKTFLALPPNTVYSKYEPCIFMGHAIKMETLMHNDFDSTDDFNTAIDCRDSGEFASFLDQSQHKGASVKMEFETLQRDGCYVDELFAVWEPQDIQALIDRLQKCLPADPQPGKYPPTPFSIAKAFGD